MRFSLAATTLLAGLATAAPSSSKNDVNLDKLARRNGMLWFGTAADIPGTSETTDKSYLSILRKKFGEMTPANALKFMYTEPEQNVFNFTQGDYFMDLADHYGHAVRCHNLVWASQVSDWVTSRNWTATELKEVMKNHIFKTVQHFGKRCYAWDVVNEAVNGDGTFSSSVWYDTIGEEYFYLAFQYAQEALAQIHANQVKLYYNDYGIENPGPKADAVLKLVAELRKRGIRIDGVGLESHFIVGETPSLADQLATKKAYIEAGLEVAITELDVRFSQAPFYTAEAQKQQAADYYASVASCKHAGPRCVGVVVWDFDDAYSWIPGTFEGQGGACLYNETLEVKPAFYAAAEALENKPCTLPFDRRYVRFDVDALCNVAVVADDEPSPIITIEKMEGGFSKALLIQKENGKEGIAKVPCRIAGPAGLTTASEHTGIPVPRVLAWSSDSSSPVGAEYIVMEKAAGVPLFQRWADMAEIDRLQLIKNLTKLEAQLSSIGFPAYGGLYLRADTGAQQSNYQMLNESIDPSHTFCIGPSCDRSFDIDPDTALGQSKGHLNQGPWNTISDVGICIAKRELSPLSRKRLDRPPTFYQGSVEEQAELLQSTMSLMPLLDSHPALVKSGRPILWHTDLHMGNIYVAPDESSQVVSLIDFQSLSVLLAFLQAQWPIFLKPPPNYPKGFVQPRLPDDFDELDEESKSLAQQEWSQAKWAKAYEVSTYLEDRFAYDAMNVPRVFRELFIRCAEVSEVGVVPLRACLIEMFQNWSGLGFTGQCPLSFTEEEIKTHERQFTEYEAWHEVQRLAWECLDTDAEGWIAPQLDITEKRRQNRALLSTFLERTAGEWSPEEARQMWPFPEEA
ncbi:hypothetical protein KXW54_002771 [Aspergillus fumigatus]|nr:hypothetical protein KXW54_002771 [Aspergillus fumigatus]